MASVTVRVKKIHGREMPPYQENEKSRGSIHVKTNQQVSSKE